MWWSRAYSRQGSFTGQLAQIRRAIATPTPSLGKKMLAGWSRHLPCIIQLVSTSTTSVDRPSQTRLGHQAANGRRPGRGPCARRRLPPLLRTSVSEGIDNRDPSNAQLPANSGHPRPTATAEPSRSRRTDRHPGTFAILGAGTLPGPLPRKGRLCLLSSAPDWSRLPHLTTRHVNRS